MITRNFPPQQVWFQNQRAKVKKNQKKGRLENKSNSMSGSNKDTDNSSDEMDKAMILKDEQQSKFREVYRQLATKRQVINKKVTFRILLALVPFPV